MKVMLNRSNYKLAKCHQNNYKMHIKHSDLTKIKKRRHLIFHTNTSTSSYPKKKQQREQAPYLARWDRKKCERERGDENDDNEREREREREPHNLIIERARERERESEREREREREREKKKL